MDYTPTSGPLPGEQWTPSNGDDGYSFITDWCGTCARDKAAREGANIDECDDNEKCPILGASFRGEAVEWRNIDGVVKCISWVEHGKPIPPPRDDKTIDMFAA